MRKTVLWLAFLFSASIGTVGTAQAAEPMAGHAMMANPAAAQESCGQMLSSMAGIPAKLAEGASSVADMLDAHAALLGKDKDSQAEAKGMRAIAKTHKQIAASLTKASEEMKKASSWPAAPHDMAKMSADPKLAAANQKVIDVHKEIIAMMQKMVAEMEAHQKAMPQQKGMTK